MQDRYAGDLGDFLKLGLLRWLIAPVGDSGPLSLGVVWYLTADEAHNEDGKHVAYLDADHRSAAVLRAKDPALYDALRSVVADGTRSVEALERAGALPRDTVTYRERLGFSDLASADRAGRIARRAAWLEGALDVTRDADLVFLDPDNGVRSVDHPTGRHHTKAEKHAYLDEIGAFAARGQSVVVYHHADRSAPVWDQAKRRLEMLATAVPAPPLAAVRASRGTVRLFLVCPAPQHAARLTARLQELQHGPWASELVPRWFREDLEAPIPRLAGDS